MSSDRLIKIFIYLSAFLFSITVNLSKHFNGSATVIENSRNLFHAFYKKTFFPGRERHFSSNTNSKKKKNWGATHGCSTKKLSKRHFFGGFFLVEKLKDVSYNISRKTLTEPFSECMLLKKSHSGCFSFHKFLFFVFLVFEFPLLIFLKYAFITNLVKKYAPK